MAQKDTGGFVILFLLNSYVEKPISIPSVNQFSFFHWCVAEKTGLGVQLFREIELHSEISVISWY